MSILINCNEISKRYQSKTIFSGLNFSIHARDRIGLVGANGAGKSTLMRILAGHELADEGDVSVKRMLKIVYVPQELEWDQDLSMHQALFRYGQKLGLDDDEAHLKASIALSQAHFDFEDKKISSLSGGQKKRLSLARVYINEPDLVLLDEPTNHMDWDALDWLHQLLEQAAFAWLIVSHDRFLLDKRCHKIADIHPMYRDGIKLYSVSYSKFLEQKQLYMEELTQQQASLSNRVRREVEWLRSGVKARTTKSRSRQDAAHRLIDELGELKQRLHNRTTDLSFSSSGRKTKQLLTLKSVSFSYPAKPILKDIDLVMTSGMKLGILGGNGSGKTTLIKLLVGELLPQDGDINRAQNIKMAYFSQNRDALDPKATVQDNLCEAGGDSIVVGDRVIHVISWAQRFLLSPAHLSLPLSELSGGEKARVGIAKLMAKQADVLVLDEPTNDLDIETVQVLERSLQEFAGALILVSHDRALLENVCDVYFGLNGHADGLYFAELAQWQQWLRKTNHSDIVTAKREQEAIKPLEKKPKKLSKLTYKEKYELDQMESLIQKAEAKVKDAEVKLEDPMVIADPQHLNDVARQLEDAQSEVDRLYVRWDELESKKKMLDV